jgi:biopolymer transport protein ExbD
MRRHALPRVHTTHPNVTPLIDVVMVLIVFFMLVAKIGVNTGADLSIVVPATIKGQDIKDMGNTLTLNVMPGPGDEPIVTALVRDRVREVKIVDPANRVKQLRVELERIRFGQDMRDGGDGVNADNPEFKVIIRAPEDLDYRYIEPVLVACAEARVRNVNFNTRRGREAEIAAAAPQ